MCKITKTLVCLLGILILMNIGVLLNDELNTQNIVMAAVDTGFKPIGADGTTGCATHSYSWRLINSATCTSAGKEEKFCKVCKVVAQTKTTPALGHEWKEATCTEPKTCTRCEMEYGFANGHSMSAATCTSPAKCKTCGITGTKALDHDWQDATCTAPQICSRCKTSTGKSLGHNMAAATCLLPSKCTRCNITSGTALGHDMADATCTKPKTCTRCQATSGKALGHNWQAATCTTAKKCKTCNVTEGGPLNHNYAAATCTEPKTCTRCQATTGTTLKHDYGDANCTSPAKCKNCGISTGSAIGHDYTEATCTMAKECKRCGLLTGTALGHNYSIAATCTTAKKCSRCDATTGNALGHDWKAATCTNAGICTRCRISSGKAIGHDFEYIKIDSTWHIGNCTRCDYSKSMERHNMKNNECTICEYKEETTTKECIHTYAAATCTEPKTCTKCGETVGKELGHDYSGSGRHDVITCNICGFINFDGNTMCVGETVIRPATCTTDGEMGMKCDICGEIFVEKTESALGHDYVYTKIDSINHNVTCKRDGCDYEEVVAHTYKNNVCTKCNFKNTEEVSCKHNYTWRTIEEATCEQKGLLEYRCTKCNDLKNTRTKSKVSHKYSIKATCTTAKTCEYCGATSGKALGHSLKYEQIANDTINHKVTCKRSGCDYEENVAHMFLNNKCKFCKLVKPKETTVDDNTEQTKCEHNFEFTSCVTPDKCTKCGATNGTLVGHPVYIAATCTSPAKCIICGEYEGEPLGHNYELVDTDSTKEKCTICGYEREIGGTIVVVTTPPYTEGSSHTCGNKMEFSLEYYDSYYHREIYHCNTCNYWYRPLVPHDFIDSSSCATSSKCECGAEVPMEQHELEYKKIGGTWFIKLDKMYHEVKCKNCDYKGKEKHTYATVKNGNKLIALCRCGVTTEIGDDELEKIVGMELSNYEKVSIISCDHSQNFMYKLVDYAKHEAFVYCTTCKIYVYGTQDHFGQRTICTEPLKCAGCQQQIAPPTEHTPIISCTEATICSVCKTVLEEPGHNYVYDYVDSTLHSKKCKKCGLVEQPEPHAYELEGENEYCTVCYEYNKDKLKCEDYNVVDTHELTKLNYLDDAWNYGYHTIKYFCKSCNKEVVGTEEHILNEAKICVCGYQDEGNYCTHEYDESKTKTQKISNNVMEKEHIQIKKCTICNTEIRTRESHNFNEKGNCSCGTQHNFSLYIYEFGITNNITVNPDRRYHIEINENVDSYYQSINYTYSSSDKNGKISVDDGGYLYISKDIDKKIYATITVKSQYGKTKTLKVNVIKEEKDRISITTFDNSYGTTYKYQPIKLEGQLALSDATFEAVTDLDTLEQTITWRTTNNSGTFNTKTGSVVEFTPTRAGTVEVYASVTINGKKIESKITINVKDVETVKTASNMTMMVGETKIFSNVEKLEIVSGEDCINLYGKLVIAKMEGLCILKDEKGTIYTINVVEELIYISDVEISLAKEKLFVGDETDLIIKVSPANATEEYKVTVSSGLEYNDGKVKALNTGVKTIKVKAKNKEQTFKVEVKNESLKIKNQNIKVDISNETYKIEVDTSNLRNGDKSVITFESSNKDIFDIKQDGTIIPKYAGKATLTVTTEAQEYKNKQLQPKTLKATAQVQITGKGYTGLNDAVYLKSGVNKDSKEILIFVPGNSGLNWGSERDLKANSDCYYTYGNGNKYNNDVFTYGKAKSVGSSEYVIPAIFEQYGISSVEEFNAKGYTINLAGFSDGGTIAIQMAHELVEAGFNVDTLALFDSNKDGLAEEENSWHSTRDDGLRWTGNEQVSAMVTCDGVNLITVYSEEGKNGSGSSAETRNLGESLAEEKEQLYKDDDSVGTVEVVGTTGTTHTTLLQSDEASAILDELAGGVAE